MMRTVTRYGFLLTLTAVLLSTFDARAQYDETDFELYTIRDGLSDLFVNCLKQDAKGYLWIGTDIGLNRFDGEAFESSFPISFKSSEIRELKSVGPDQIAIVSRRGLLVFNTKDFTHQAFTVPDSTAFGLHRNNIWDVLPLEDQSLLVTSGTGIYHFTPSGHLIFRHDGHVPADLNKKRFLYGREIFSISATEHLIYIDEDALGLYDSEHLQFHEIAPTDPKWRHFFAPKEPPYNRWISKYQITQHTFLFLHAVRNAIVYYDHLSQAYVSSPLPHEPLKEFNWESKIYPLNDSTFTLTSAVSGFYLFHLNKRTGKITFQDEKFLPSYRIRSLYKDKENRLWAGTTQGLLKQKLTQLFMTQFGYPKINTSTRNSGFQNAYRHLDKLYVANYSRSTGLLVIDTASMQIEHQLAFFGKDSRWNEISSVQMYHPDTLWLGTNAGLLWLDTRSLNYGKIVPGNGPDENTGLIIIYPVDKTGHAWFCYLLEGWVGKYHVGTRKFTFYSNESTPQLPFKNVKSIAYDADGDVWLGGHALARWNNRVQAFDTLITEYGGENKYADDILTLQADSEGSLWLHNAFNCLLEYRIREKHFISYTTRDGLPSDVFQCFSTISDSILWIGDNGHLTRYNIQSGKARVYDQKDGLPGDRSTSRYIYHDVAENTLYLFYTNTIVKFRAHPVSEHNFSSDLLIHQVVINGKREIYRPISALQLNSEERNITIKYTVINFENPNGYRYAYRLNDQSPWQSLGQETSLNLSELSSGSYFIQIRAESSDGDEKFAKLAFNIAPPFWKTAWFLTLCIIVLASGTIMLFRRRISSIRQRANIDRQLVQAEMHALHAQMNPHFVFNSLNSIREMILNNENTDASRYLSKFAHLIRVTLDQSHQSFVSLRNTVDYLNRYIEMEKIRNAHFRFEISTDPVLDPDETILPPMLIQPFIENAIWHGVNGSDRGIEIDVKFSKKEDLLECTIDDNGIGIRRSLEAKKQEGDTAHQSLGIANIQHRIDLLNKKYRQQSSVTIQDKATSGPMSGTRITITLPLDMEHS